MPALTGFRATPARHLGEDDVVDLAEAYRRFGTNPDETWPQTEFATVEEVLDGSRAGLVRIVHTWSAIEVPSTFEIPVVEVFDATDRAG